MCSSPRSRFWRVFFLKHMRGTCGLNLREKGNFIRFGSIGAFSTPTLKAQIKNVSFKLHPQPSLSSPLPRLQIVSASVDELTCRQVSLLPSSAYIYLSPYPHVNIYHETDDSLRVASLGQSVDKPRGQPGESGPQGRPKSFQSMPQGQIEGHPRYFPKDFQQENPKRAFNLPLGQRLRTQGTVKGTDSPGYFLGFSTDCHSVKIPQELIGNSFCQC